MLFRSHDLKRLIRRGLFREDLFFRLNVVPIRLPALRNRVEDIPELVRHFLARAASNGLPWKIIEPEAVELFKGHGWPGNVRELENLVQRLAALYSEEVIGPDIIRTELNDGSSDTDVPASANGGLSEAVDGHLRTYFGAHDGSLPTAGLYNRILREVERPLILQTLQATRGNQVKAAEVLGLNRNTLRKKIRELGIPIIKGAE